MAESGKATNTTAEMTEQQQRFRRLMAQGAREGAVLALIVLCIYLAMALFTFSTSIDNFTYFHIPSLFY